MKTKCIRNEKYIHKKENENFTPQGIRTRVMHAFTVDHRDRRAGNALTFSL